MAERKYLAQEGVINCNEFEEGKLNIIESPCGSGKTTLVENVLWKESWCGDLLYLVDSKNGLEAFKRRGERKEYEGKVYYKHNGITAMTYATFAVLSIHQNENQWLWDDECSFIVCDELQNCIKWSKIFDDDINLHQVALEQIHKRIRLGAIVVAISATTDKIRKEFRDEIFEVPIHAELHRYEVLNRVYYENINNILNSLPTDKIGLIYVPHIRQMIDVYNYLSAERGVKCATIWSINASAEMSEDDLRVRSSIIEKELIPEDIQVTIINSSCETGLNIKSQVDYVVVNTTDKDTVIQVVGRVRHDVDTVYYLEKQAGSCIYITYERIAHWLGIPLDMKKKKELCQELNLRDYRGRLCGWTTAKTALEFSGFIVTNHRFGSGKSYSVIS